MRNCEKFANEAEEAQWWFDNRDQVAANLVAASRAGRRGEGSLERQQRKSQGSLHDTPSAIDHTHAAK